MKVVDLNLLLYAINRDAPDHLQARRWWETALSEFEDIGLAWPVILGFLRLTTRQGLFPRPLPLDDAIQIVGEWLRHPRVVLIQAGQHHWSVLQDLLVHSGAGGNLTTDAHLATLAIEYAATLFTSDGDFARFGERLAWKNPLR